MRIGDARVPHADGSRGSWNKMPVSGSRLKVQRTISRKSVRCLTAVAVIGVAWLALPVGVAAQSAPDLEVAFAEVDDSTPVEGGRFTLYVTVGNFGDAESAATTLRYYQSTDATISSEDTQVGTAAVGALGVSGISLSQEEIDLTAPSTAGTYGVVA